MAKGVRLQFLLPEMIKDKDEREEIAYILETRLDLPLDTEITEEDFPMLYKKIDQAKEINQEPDDDYEDEEEDDDEVSFYCSNDSGEGMVTFTNNGSEWTEYWDEWEPYEDDDPAPTSMHYAGYLNKKELKQWLSQDGFNNITEVR